MHTGNGIFFAGERVGYLDVLALSPSDATKSVLLIVFALLFSPATTPDVAPIGRVILHITPCQPALQTPRPGPVRASLGLFTWDKNANRIHEAYRFALQIDGPTLATVAVATGAYEYDVVTEDGQCNARAYMAVLAGHSVRVDVFMSTAIADPLNTGFAAGEVRADVPLAGAFVDRSVACGDQLYGKVNSGQLKIEDGAYYFASGVFGDPAQPVLRLGADSAARFIRLRIPAPVPNDGTNMNALPTLYRLDVTPSLVAAAFSRPAGSLVCI